MTSTQKNAFLVLFPEMADNDPKNDDNLETEDFSSLSDREMIRVATQELAALRERAKTDPDISQEQIAAIEAALNKFIADVKASEDADRALAASAKKLARSTDHLLSLAELQDGKPIPISLPKGKGH